MSQKKKYWISFVRLPWQKTFKPDAVYPTLKDAMHEIKWLDYDCEYKVYGYTEVGGKGQLSKRGFVNELWDDDDDQLFKKTVDFDQVELDDYLR